MDFTTLFIQLASGAVASSLAVSAWRHLSLGSAGNVLAGAIGGGLGGLILGTALGTAHMAAATGLNPGIIVSEMAAGAAGGVALFVVAGALHRALAR